MIKNKWQQDSLTTTTRMVNSGERSDCQRGRSGNRSTNNTSDNTTKKNTNKSGPRGTSQNAVEGAARNGSNVVIADNRNREHEGVGNTNSHQTNIHKTSFNQRANNQNNNRNSDDGRINSNMQIHQTWRTRKEQRQPCQ